ncbi:Vigilin 1 [Rhizoctonia solani]|uniref:Vigilin 1 n=1 Tax=Rhizoctonia solani TaxID=456999 RepID=A0A0K6FKY1_9AGAM|nr:Vigilin 1 [Rhizoctonia solani]
MAESAAQALQRRHDELEGAPDPFPPMSSGQNGDTRRATKKNGPLNTEDEDAFPSLASAAPAKPAVASAWSAAVRIRQAAPRVVAPVFSDSFTLENIDLSTAGKDGKPTTLNEVLKRVMLQHKNVKLEASTQRKDGRAKTSFVIKADSEAEVEAAKRKLTAALSPVVTRVVQSPVSAIGSIVGQKGANLNQLRAKYEVRVDIPRKDTGLAPPVGSSGAVSPTPADEDEEPIQPISVTGPLSSVVAAIAEIKAVISTKTANITQRVRDVPIKIFPFIEGRRSDYEEAVSNESSISVNSAPESREITVSGDRQGVVKTVEQIKKDIEELENSITSISIPVKKPKHRLLVGDFAQELMTAAKCAIELPGEPDNEIITLWGLSEDLPNGLMAINKQGDSQYTQTITIPAPSGPICEYLVTTAYFGSIWGPKFPGVEGYPVPRGKGHVIDFVGEKDAVAPVVKDLNKLFQDLAGSVRQVEIDWLLHKPLAGKFTKKIEQFRTANHTEIHFPEESEERSTVLLVYDLGKSSSKTEKKKHLDEVERELKKLVAETGNVRSEEVTVDKKWHQAIIGKNDSNLNAITGEEKVLSIKFGSQARLNGDNSLSEDTILIRGPSSDVTRALEAIKQLAEKAKNDEIESSYVTEFDIPQEYARHIVGSGGSGINKLRDQLDVKVDLNDDGDKEGTDTKKKGKKPTTKTHVKITGRKANADDAKKRILAQVERLEDETTETLKIPNKYHSGLIGTAGKYVSRLEEKYGVKINFGGEESRGRGQAGNLGPDEVMVKGGRKGVASAKSELLEAYEYEKETNQSVEFTVPSRAVARILGRGGSQINEIKEDTNTQIDVEKADAHDPKAETLITVRGTKAGIADAKKQILAIASEVGEETTVTINIENRFHRTLIGAGGQGLKDLIAKVGGPSEPKAQTGLIHFPRNGETDDEVTLRGEPALVKKLQKELEKIVAELRDRVVLGVDIPAQQHRVLIGRGGQHLNELQDRHNVTVQFPGSRSYHQIGEPENADELADVPPENIVKVSGSRSACEKAMKEMSDRPAPQEQVTTTIMVPLRYVHSISQQGTFFRSLRQVGVQVDQSQQPNKAASTPRPPPPSGGAARIDEEPIEEAVQWQVTENHQDGEEGEAEWTLRGRDQAALDKARNMIEEAITQAQSASHVGFLTLADRSAFPRIVGTKGASVARLRNETGAEITVGRDDNTIVIIGSESVIEHAKSKILDIVNNSARPRAGRSRDDED